MMTELEFKSLAEQGYNRIPIIAEFYADLDTPLSLYLKMAHHTNHQSGSFLLESVVGGERFGRYSFIGLPTSRQIRARQNHVEVLDKVDQHIAVVESSEGNPLDFIADYLARYNTAPIAGLPRFAGGLVGYFGYDAVRYVEPRLNQPHLWKTGTADPLNMPDIHLLHTEEVIVVDNLAGKIYVIVYADPYQPEALQRAKQKINDLRMKLRAPIDIPYSLPSVRTETYREFPKADYLAAVEKAKDYIMAGDMMQVQVGQRIQKPFRDSPLTLYRALRSINPSPYMYFYNFGDYHVVGASPEILVRQEKTAAGTKVTIRPLAGTRPRGMTAEHDAALEQELLSDPKERAEHVMLIDLARNDIGRIAKTGSVKVSDQMVVERYSHVMHIVSNVEGILQDGMTNMDVFKATFPAGTLSGAPKVRAMEIIDELEPTKRGVYGGACGYISFSGEMDLAIAIRTGIIKDGMLYAQAAAGVVADSIPDNEWQETENKARAVLRAAEQAQDGLDVER
jgi:anthranilate synthase component 1